MRFEEYRINLLSKSEGGGALYSVRERVLVVTDAQVNTQHFLNMIAQGSHAVIDTFSGVLSRLNLNSEKGDTCKYHMSREIIEVTLDALAVRRNSRFLAQINYILSRLQHFGILPYLKKKYSHIICEENTQHNSNKPLALVQVEGPFYVLLFGLVLASTSFLAEMLFMPWFTSRTNYRKK